MTQTIALFIDAYRELNAKKMFWITLVLSGVVTCLLLVVGIGESRHLKVLVWETPIPLAPETDLGSLLKSWFVYLGIAIWLTWAATVLALISTASIFPDLLTSGAVDLVLSKPISRVRLFLTKYIGGLLFVALQVTVFSAASFLIIGLRSGQWELGLLLAVPLVVLFYSYLFSICTFWGVLTRSTIAALLATILCWILLFVLNAGDSTLLMPRSANEVFVEKLGEQLARAKADPERQESAKSLESQLHAAEDDLATWNRWHGAIFTIKTLLPKTGETIGLLERWLIEAANLPDDEETDDQFPFITAEMWTAGVRPSDVIERADQAIRARSVTWVIGTSIGFEIVMLGLACFIFVRRDY